MQANGNSPNARSRGIIVVDAGALMDMENSVPSSFREGKDGIRTYLDVLVFLANQGFEIIIPEIVSYEVTSIICGSNLNTFFNGPRSEEMRHTELAAFLEMIDHDRTAQPRRWPNITLVPTTPENAPPRVAGYMSRLHGIVDHPASDVRKQLMGIQTEDKTDLADDAIKCIFDKLIPKIGNKPIFLLSTDRTLMESISTKHPQAGILSVSGLLHSLLMQKFHPVLGLRPVVNFRTVMSDMSDQINAISHGRCGDHPLVLDLSGRKYLEFSRLRGTEYFVKDKPFGKIMAELAVTLHLTPPPAVSRH